MGYNQISFCFLITTVFPPLQLRKSERSGNGIFFVYGHSKIES